MYDKEPRMITYPEMLQELESSDQDRHLLLGNGFNNSLGIGTNYEDIFKKMIEEDPIYKKIESKLEKYDIEKLIKSLKECINKDSVFNNFLGNYIENKVKFDFMKSASSIVRQEIKGVYQDKNQEIYLLLKNFSNYFTLNYDTLLYLILMKFKKSSLTSSEVDTIAFQKSCLSQQQDLDEIQDEIYTQIKQLLENGKITTEVNNETLNTTDLNKLPKATFEKIIINYNDHNNKKWKHKYIEIVCDRIWEEKNSKFILESINDGFQGELFENNRQNQNLFFLHGSFHLYEDKKKIRKITRKTDKAVYERLERIIGANEKDIICVFTSESKDKLSQIKDNQYLRKSFDKLSSLSGTIVILGSALSDNDSHIFDAINKSKINKIYISTSKKLISSRAKKSKEFFPDKEIILFDHETISYS